jgi:hypothetical protein
MRQSNSNLLSRSMVFGRVIGLTLAACHLLCATAYGWNEPDGFKKLKWGDPIDGVKEVMKVRDREIRNLGPHGRRFTGWDSVGNIPVTLYLDFLDGKLAGVSFTFPATEFETIRSAFVERYGKPSSQLNETAQSDTGVKVPNVMSFWIGETVDVTLAQVGASLDQSLAILETKPWIAYKKTLGSSKTKKAAGDL